MMEWSWGAIAVILSLLLSIIAFTRTYGEDRGENRAWKKMIEETLARHTKEHGEHREAHQEHMNDDEAHWTGRERGMLAKQLDRIEGLIRELLMPRSSGTVGRTRNNHHEPDKP